MVRLLIPKQPRVPLGFPKSSVSPRQKAHALTLVLAGDPILGHVGVNHRPGLEKQLPQQRLAHLLVQAPHVHGGIWTTGGGGWGREAVPGNGDDRNVKVNTKRGHWG